MTCAAFLRFFCSELLLELQKNKSLGGPPKVYKRSLLRGVTTLGVYDYVLAWLFPSSTYIRMYSMYYHAQ